VHNMNTHGTRAARTEVSANSTRVVGSTNLAKVFELAKLTLLVG
jgi:hypothetical protein